MTREKPMQLKQIVAMGGGGWAMEPENPLLDDYIFRLPGRKKVRVCFLATAFGDSAECIDRFYEAMRSRKNVVPTHLPLFARESTAPEQKLLAQDVIYVGGGNTANLLAVWRLHGVDRALRKAWNAGIVLTGLSAGMNCWFEACSTDSFGPLAPLRDGLGLLAGSACPHYDGESERRPRFHQFLREGLPAGYAADDGAALHFIGRRLHQCVSSRPNARAYRVRMVHGEVVETTLPVRYLGTVEHK